MKMKEKVMLYNSDLSDFFLENLVTCSLKPGSSDQTGLSAKLKVKGLAT